MLGVRIEFACCRDPFQCTYEGGDSSADTSSKVETTNVDKRQVVDGNSVGVTADNSDVRVSNTQTDHGTVKAAFDLATTNTAAVGHSFKDVLGFAAQALTLTKENINLQNKSASQIGDAYKTAGDIATGNRAVTTTGLIVVGLVAVGFVAVAFKKQGSEK